MIRRDRGNAVAMLVRNIRKAPFETAANLIFRKGNVRVFSGARTSDKKRETTGYGNEAKESGILEEDDEKHRDGEEEEDMVDMFNDETGEWNGPRGLEPTRYGDWESKGRCWDF